MYAFVFTFVYYILHSKCIFALYFALVVEIGERTTFLVISRNDEILQLIVLFITLGRPSY